MADNVNDEKIWATTNSNVTHHHAFTARDGKLRAMCRKNIRPVDGTTEDRLYSKRRRVDQLMLTGTFCDSCWAKVTAMVDRRNASMEPAQERHDAGYVASADERQGPVQEYGQYVSTESDGSGIRFRRLPAGHPSTVTARNKRQLMLWGGTMWSTWTVGNPVGWYGIEAAWKSADREERSEEPGETALPQFAIIYVLSGSQKDVFWCEAATEADAIRSLREHLGHRSFIVRYIRRADSEENPQ